MIAVAANSDSPAGWKPGPPGAGFQVGAPGAHKRGFPSPDLPGISPFTTGHSKPLSRVPGAALHLLPGGS
ncbi:hypothetical protein ASZ90_016344 [hydrocarbon metagenome]|uniref:Uncharacterized protein n=1 Tax=hydrocarbon metagenome TaxID=938273 RepID=A0A0W8EYE7_9ZZZZ